MTSDRLVFVHGFTQTHHSWLGPAALITAGVVDSPSVVSLDAPGHGTRSAEHLDLVDGADALVERGGVGTWIGYSMGARFCLHAALQHPTAVQRLVLIGGTPGIENVEERRRRRHDDEMRARRIEAIGVEAFIDEWLQIALLSTLRRDAADVAHRLTNTTEGLASSLRLAGTGSQRPLWDRLDELSMPVLVLAGALDTKFIDIGARMAARMRDATFDTVPDAGHTAHLEQPRGTAEAVSEWLGRTTE